MQLALVYDADSLALAADDGLGRNKMDLRSDAQHGAHGGCELSLSCEVLGNDIGELLGSQLDVDVEGVAVVLAVDDDLVVRGVALLEQHRIGLHILTCVLPQEHFSRVSTQISRVL